MSVMNVRKVLLGQCERAHRLVNDEVEGDSSLSRVFFEIFSVFFVLRGFGRDRGTGGLRSGTVLSQGSWQVGPKAMVSSGYWRIC